MTQQLLTVHDHTEAGHAVVRAEGEIDIVTAPQLGARLASVLDTADLRTLVVDLREVTFLGSNGLSVLIGSELTARERNIPFAVAATRPVVLRILSLTHVDQVLTVVAQPSDFQLKLDPQL